MEADAAPAVRHTRGGDPRAAIRACTRILEVGRVDADDRLLAHVHRAHAYDAVGDRGRAKKDYDWALSIAPKSPWVYRNRGAMFIGAGQLDEALRDFDAAVSLDPSYGYAWTSRGNVRRLLAEREPRAAERRALNERALLDCERAFAAGRLDTFRAGAHEVRSLVHQALGHTDLALADAGALDRARKDVDAAWPLSRNSASAQVLDDAREYVPQRGL